MSKKINIPADTAVSYCIKLLQERMGDDLSLVQKILKDFDVECRVDEINDNLVFESEDFDDLCELIPSAKKWSKQS